MTLPRPIKGLPNLFLKSAHEVGNINLESYRQLADELMRIRPSLVGTDIARLPGVVMRYADVAIRNLGQTAQQVAARFNVTHAEDLAHLEELATQTANTDGPRLANTEMQYAEAAIRNQGHSVQQVAARFNVTHAEDLAHLEELTRSALP